MRTESSIVLSAVMFVAACGQIEPMRIAAKGSNAPVVAVLDNKPANAVEIGQVNKTTCLNRFWDRRAGWDIALDAAKTEAAAKGANALVGVRYEDGRVLPCGSSLKVTGTAIRVP
jgi:hypothetical protein